MKHFLVAGLLLATLVSVKTYAQQRNHKGFFKKIDTDGDGKFSKAEVNNASKDNKWLSKLKENFAAIDVNKDFFLDKDQLKAYRKSQGPRKKTEGNN